MKDFFKRWLAVLLAIPMALAIGCITGILFAFAFGDDETGWNYWWLAGLVLWVTLLGTGVTYILDE